VVVRAEISGDRLLLRVDDDGGRLDAKSDTLPDGPSNGQGGIGLSNLRDRLQRLYGADQSLALRVTPSGVTRVTLDLPYTRP
jgi:LytS/YehU family sensor histidine kinase